MSEPFAHLKSTALTDTGLKRKNNEDSLISLPNAGIFCVADGMGGTKGGEVASKATVDALEQTFTASPDAAFALTAKAGSRLVIRALNQASCWIKERAEELGLSGTGSTAVALVFDQTNPAIATLLHAGDSRAYRWRNNKLQQLSQDHSVAAAAGLDDENKLPAMFRGVITRAVGLERTVEIEETSVEVVANDLYLLCSDGLTKMVSDKNITRLLKQSLQTELPDLAQSLINAALKAGGSDNVSIILIQVAPTLPTPAITELPPETLALEALPDPYQQRSEAPVVDEAETTQTADTAGFPKVGFTPVSGGENLTPPQPLSTEGTTPTDLKHTLTTGQSVTPGKNRRKSRVWLWLIMLLLIAGSLTFFILYNHN